MQVIELIRSTIQEDAITLGIFLLILGALMILNILLGSIEAWVWSEFKTKKFWVGVLKAVLTGICMIAFMVILEIVPLVLERVKISVPKDFVTFLQLVTLVWVSVQKYIKSIFEKFKFLLGDTDTEKITGEETTTNEITETGVGEAE